MYASVEDKWKVKEKQMKKFPTYKLGYAESLVSKAWQF